MNKITFSLFLSAIILLSEVKISAQDSLSLKTPILGGLIYYRNNVKITKSEFNDALMQRDENLYYDFDKYRSNYKTANVFLFLGAALTGIGIRKIANADKGNNSGIGKGIIAIVGLGAATYIISTVFYYVNRSKMKNVLKKKYPKSSFRFQIAPNKIGFCLNLNSKFYNKNSSQIN